MKPAVLVSTFPDRAIIDSIASQLVTDKIVACVNISKITSIYRWEEAIHNTDEFLAIFKTTQKNLPLLKKQLKQLHPYDVPEIAEINIDSINSDYMKWIADSTL